MLLRHPRHPITVKNVLSHTSGLPFKSVLEEPTLDLFPLTARVHSYAMTPLEFEPDSNCQYRNTRISTVARIIEVVAGRSYEEFLDERLFQPLRMKDATFWPSKEQVARIAKTNTIVDTQRGLILVWLVQHAGCSGEGNKSQPTKPGHDETGTGTFNAAN